ncbi:TonB-dependent receptor [Lacinutrix sp. MEBiC02404]
MKNLYFFWLLFGYIGMSYAQTITILDQQNEKPLEGVFLISENPIASIVTNAKGQADISAFKEADNIQIHALGYETKVFSFTQIKSFDFWIHIEPSNLNLDEVVVSATRWRQTSGNVPSKIATISAKEVAFQNPQTAADLLSVSGQVYVQKSQQGGGSPMIRGFATNRLIYTVDGVRMNSAIFRAGNLQNVINLDPFATESTEVLFGPGSVIYGSDAIGGVMSFQTLTPQLSLTDKPLITGKAITRYSSANKENTVHFDVNIGLKKWSSVTSFSSWSFDDLKQGSHGPDDYLKPIHVQRIDSLDQIVTQSDPLIQSPSGYSQINLMQKIRFKPNEKWDFQYGFHYSETSPYGRYDRNQRYKNGTLRYALWYYGPQKWMMNNLTITNKANNAIYDEMTIRLALQNFGESRMDRTLNKKDLSENVENVKAYSANLDFLKSLGAKNTLYYGTEFVYDDVTSKGSVTDITTGITTDGASRYPISTWTSIAAYVNDEYRITDKFTAIAGLRYNHYAIKSDFTQNLPYYPLPFSSASINNAALTGSLGGVYRPTDKWVIKANFGTAFRSPNVDDVGKVFDSELGGVTVPNPDLEAEYAYNFDLGIAKVFGNHLKVDLTGYYTILQNAMVKRNFQLNGMDEIIYNGELSQVQAIQNAAVAKVYGIQASAEVKLPEGFTVSANVNYQVGEEELNDGTKSPSRHAPPVFGVARLNYEVHKLQLQFYGNYMAERKHDDLPFGEQSKVELYAKDANGETYAPSWYTLNIKAMYPLSDILTINTGIENLTDQRYRPYSSGISGAGRNFILSLKANL